MLLVEHSENLKAFEAGGLSECSDDRIYPLLECRRFFSSGSHDDGVYPDFRDDRHFLLSAGGVHNPDILLVIVEHPEHVRRVPVSERCGNIRRYRPPVARLAFHDSGFDDLSSSRSWYSCGVRLLSLSYFL